MRSITTALAPLECRHPRLGQSLWRLGVMRPQCLHAHAAPAGVLVCPAGRPGEAYVCVCACVPKALLPEGNGQDVVPMGTGRGGLGPQTLTINQKPFGLWARESLPAFGSDQARPAAPRSRK